ncbi:MULTISPECIES: hypothetical protein [Cupriavidus]
MGDAIAAFCDQTALVHDITIVTRNADADDFAACGARLLNPFA